MERFIKPSRLAVCAVFMAALLALYSLTLYKLQIVEGEQYVKIAGGGTSVTRQIAAVRGSIFDRNGTLLVSDRTVYNIKIDRKVMLKMDDPNSAIRALLAAAAEYGVSYNDQFPVTKTAPFEYDAGASKWQLSCLNAYFDYFSALEPTISAADLMIWLRDHYKVSFTIPAEEARKIIGIRYELEMRAIVNTEEYFFAQDVPVAFVNYIAEQNFPCVSVSVESQRQYHTAYAAHILGYVGSVEREEYDQIYKDQGYPLNATVGKTGAERAFENYLHGVSGSVTTHYDADGAVTGVTVNREPVAGSNVYLTIDIGLQEKAEKALAANIARINADREAAALEKAIQENKEPEAVELAPAGAVVIRDVNTGEVLAMASYPTYDLATVRSNWSSVSSDASKPLWNRATSGTYNPGSTFKMVTALAGLREGVITGTTRIEDKVKYTAYEDYQPSCWNPYGHGTINVVEALAQSCNYFFYYVSDQMDIDPIAKAARDFGFGSPTGIEIGENSGRVASRELKIALGSTGWWKADTLITAIGHGLNEFTPVQIASYAAAIANGGTLYKTTILRSVTPYDHSGILRQGRPEVMNTVSNDEGYISLLQRGMRAVVTDGTAQGIFYGFRIPVAAKTGTVQSAGSAINDGVFICYAPASDPEIAISVVVEKGGSGSALAPIGKELLDTYFTDALVTSDLPFDNAMKK